MRIIILLCLFLTGCGANSNDNLQRFGAALSGFGAGINDKREAFASSRLGKALVAMDNAQEGDTPTNNYGGGTPVYQQSQCTGAQVNGECHGSVIGAPSAVCHGSMLHGECIGVLMPR